MPILSIISQPISGSLVAAYRPIVLRVQAVSSTNAPVPPVVYCDVYINGTFYKTLSKTQYAKLNTSNSEWQFDIQDATQEVLTKYIGDNGASAIIKTSGLSASVQCLFRSTGFDNDGFIVTDYTAPVQATGENASVAGTGYASNTFFVLNTALQFEDNQDLATHLSFFRNGFWSNDAYPLSHHPSPYYIEKNVSDYFPVVYTGTDALRCLQLTLTNLDGSVQTFTSCSACPLVVSGISIVKDTQVHTDGNIYYNASFTETGGVVDHYTIEAQEGSGAFVDITNAAGNAVTWGNGTASYNLGNIETNHTIRITPYCSTSDAGASATAIYTIPVCVPVGVITLAPLPYVGGSAYYYEYDLSGTAPFTLSNLVVPSQLTIAITGSTLVISGTEAQGTGAVSVSGTVANACGSQNVSAQIAESATTNFTGDTTVQDTATTNYTTVQIQGSPNSTIVMQLTSYVNNNGGTLRVNGAVATLNQTFTFTLNSQGQLASPIAINIDGVQPNLPNTFIMGRFTITSASGGTLANSPTFQATKAF